jgi:outer membrane lipoprotein LolB
LPYYNFGPILCLKHTEKQKEFYSSTEIAMIQPKFSSLFYAANRISWLLFVSCLLTNCATKPKTTPALPIPTTAPSWATRQAALNKLTTFTIKGKIAVQTPQESGSATLDWSQQQDHYLISLYGPLGAGGLKLSGQPGHITLKTNDGKTSTAGSPESLLKKVWGFNVPVSNLRYWVRGIPVPKLAYDSRLDNEHRLRQLIQAGYSIQFLGYTHTDGFDLPNKIFITSPSLKTKLIIYQWQAS